MGIMNGQSESQNSNFRSTIPSPPNDSMDHTSSKNYTESESGKKYLKINPDNLKIISYNFLNRRGNSKDSKS